MIARHSIRFRLTIWYALALTAGLLLFAGAIWLSTWHKLHSDVDRSLQQNTSSMQAFLTGELSERGVRLPEELAEYAHALPNDTLVRVAGQRDSTNFTTRPDFPWRQTPSEDDSWTNVEWRQTTYRVFSHTVVLKGDSWRITFAASLENVRFLLQRLGLLLLGLIPFVIALAVFGGTWLSRRALKPVDEITKAARRISIQNLSERLSVPHTGDELERLSETWNGMLSRLEDAFSRLSRFTSDASHELRTPLAVIRSTAEVAARKSRSAEAYREALAQIVTESERMSTLMDDLLFLARCDAESLQLPTERLSLESVIEEIHSMMTPVADFKGVHLTTEFARRGDGEVTGNRPAVRRLVLVLVDNALKYSRNGGSIKISLERNARGVQVKVADDGPGIPSEELPLVFQRFYRGNLARDSASSGYGLGLALAKGIAQHHRADISVSSVYGQGCEFEVVFPVEGGKKLASSGAGLNVDHRNVI